MKNLTLTTSFIQDQKHQTKSDKFVHVTPNDVYNTLERQGFQLIDLKTGHAKSAERQDHQTTWARYRFNAALDHSEGLYYDIIAKIPHLYGSIEFFSGIFRMVCKNGLVTGSTFSSERIKHVGNALDLVAESIETMLASKTKVLDTVQSWSNIQLTIEQRERLAFEAFKLRAPEYHSVLTKELHTKLLQPRRSIDAAQDLWSVFNVVQENAMRGEGVTYLNSLNQVAKTRRLLRPQSEVAVQFNRDLFDAANSIASSVLETNKTA